MPFPRLNRLFLIALLLLSDTSIVAKLQRNSTNTELLLSKTSLVIELRRNSTNTALLLC